MGDTNATGLVNGNTVEDAVTSEIVELGDVVEETKGSVIGITLDTINAYFFG